MKLMILVLSMIVAPVIAMNNTNDICKNPYAESSMFLLWRDVVVCNNYVEHKGCQQLKASLQLYTSSDLCSDPSESAMQNLCGMAKSELSIHIPDFVEQLIVDHKIREDRAVEFAEGLIEIINKS